LIADIFWDGDATMLYPVVFISLLEERLLIRTGVLASKVPLSKLIS